MVSLDVSKMVHTTFLLNDEGYFGQVRVRAHTNTNLIYHNNDVMYGVELSRTYKIYLTV